MPDTGLFYVLALRLRQGQGGDVECVTHITIQCRKCRAVTVATEHSLVRVPGGTILDCPACGSHQALSNARFLDDRELDDLVK